MPLDPKKPSLGGKRYYTISQVSKALDVSDKTIRRWIEKQELAAYRLGRQIRIGEKDLERFLRDRWTG